MKLEYFTSLIEDKVKVSLENKEALDREDWMKMFESLKETEYHRIFQKILEHFPDTAPTKEEFLEKAVYIHENKSGYEIKVDSKPKKINQHFEFIQFKERVEENTENLFQKFSELEAKDLFDRLISLSKVQASIQQKEIFYERTEEEFKQQIPLTKNSPEYRKFLASLYNWFVTCRPRFLQNETFAKKRLSNLLGNFKLDIENPTTVRMSVMADHLVKTLEKINLEEVIEEQNDQEEEKSYKKKGITEVRNEVFYYYAKESSHYGKSPTFDNIGKDSRLLNIGAFLKIFRVFNLLKQNREKTLLKLSREELVSIFIKHSTLQKEMDVNQFAEALQEVSEKIFTEQYDKEKLTNFHELSSKEKTKKLLEVLGFNDVTKVRSILKKSHLPFHSTGESRIPEEDLSKRYKLNIEEHKFKKEMVKSWKEQKLASKLEKFPYISSTTKNSPKNTQSKSNLFRVRSSRKFNPLSKPINLSTLSKMDPKIFFQNDSDLSEALHLSRSNSINTLSKRQKSIYGLVSTNQDNKIKRVVDKYSVR